MTTLRAMSARFWFAATGVMATLGVLIDLVAGVRAGPPSFAAGWSSALHTLFFYTIQSNLLVAGVSFTLSLRPGTRSKTFSVFLLIALTAISMSGIVFNTLLMSTRGAGLAAVGSDLTHIVTPVLAFVGWLAFGPRRALSWRLIPAAFSFPLAWAGVTLLRGQLTESYPYFFVDAGRLGYVAALLNMAGLGMFFVIVAAAFVGLDWVTWRIGSDPR